MFRCCAYTTKGFRCKKNKQTDSETCHVHKEISRCSICLEYTKIPVKLNCNHRFCKDCIGKWIIKSGNCPCCRTTVLKTEFDKALQDGIGKYVTKVTIFTFILTGLSQDDINYISCVVGEYREYIDKVIPTSVYMLMRELILNNTITKEIFDKKVTYSKADLYFHKDQASLSQLYYKFIL